MMYTKSAGMQTMQVYLYNIINNSQEFAENLASGSNFMANITSEGLVAATVTLFDYSDRNLIIRLSQDLWYRELLLDR